MIMTGRIKLTALTRTYAKNEGGQNVPAYEIHFTIDSQGDYVAYVPIAQFTQATAMHAIAKVAEPVAELIDSLK